MISSKFKERGTGTIATQLCTPHFRSESRRFGIVRHHREWVGPTTVHARGMDSVDLKEIAYKLKTFFDQSLITLPAPAPLPTPAPTPAVIAVIVQATPIIIPPAALSRYRRMGFS